MEEEKTNNCIHTTVILDIFLKKKNGRGEDIKLYPYNCYRYQSQIRKKKSHMCGVSPQKMRCNKVLLQLSACRFGCQDFVFPSSIPYYLV
jgi:hypothetical protein